MQAWMRVGMWGIPFVLAFASVPVRADEAPGREGVAEVSWPLPWQPGRTLVYADTYEKSSRRGAVAMTMKSTSRTYVDANRQGEGFHQRWRSEDIVVDAGAMGAMAPIMTAAMGSFEGIVLEVALDGEGAYASLVNLDALVPRYRTTLAEMMAGIGAAVPTDGRDPAQAKAAIEGLVDQLARPEVLEAALAETPVVYNFIAGGGFAADEEHHFEDEGAMPLGEGTVRRDNTLLLTAAADAPGKWDVRWEVTADPADMRAALVAATQQVAAGTPEIAAKSADALKGEVKFTTIVDYRVDASSGVVERMRKVNTKRYADREEVETSTMTLVSE